MPDTLPETSRTRTPEEIATDIAIRLAVLGFFLYLAQSLIHPFMGILIWSVVLTVAMFPVFTWIRARLGGRGGLAATLVTLLCLLVVFGPMAILSTSLVGSLENLASGIKNGTLAIPAAPASLNRIPIIGAELVDAWTWTTTHVTELFQKYASSLLIPGEFILKTIAALAGSILIFAISVVIAGFLFVPGPNIVDVARDIAHRIVGPHGSDYVRVAGTTIRGVARGIIGVAVLQALAIGTVILIAGVPHAGLLTVGVLFLAIVQIGTSPVVFPLIIWFWLSHDTMPAVLFTLALAPIGTLEHFIKPIIIGKGLDTPMVVIVIGVVGGTLTHGLTGLFIGPVVLAVAYELVKYWRIRKPDRA